MELNPKNHLGLFSFLASQDALEVMFVTEGSPPENVSRFKGALPEKGGGGLNACQDGLGHLSAPSQMDNLLD